MVKMMVGFRQRKLELFCNYRHGNFNCTTEHLFSGISFSGCSELLWCKEIQFKGIIRSNSYLVNVQCQLLSQLTQVFFFFFFFASCFDNFNLPSFSGLYPKVICTIMLTLKKQLTIVFSSNSFLSITSEMYLGLTKELLISC